MSAPRPDNGRATIADAGAVIVRRAARAAVASAARLHQLRSTREAAARLDRIGTGRREVVVGPWISEVGFEVLYWVPLLRWAMTRQAIAPERVTVLTRGGAHVWYRDLASHHVEIFDLAPPDEFRHLNEERASASGGQKQMARTEMDAELLRRAGARLQPDAELVHPSLLYQAFRYYWAARAASATVTDRLCFRRFERVAHPATARLPAHYVAVKAYHSAAFPDVPANRGFVSELVGRLSSRVPVVLLGVGESVDDHDDVAAGSEGDVLCARELYGTRDNLAAQTAIIAGADALVSSYGGFSYLAPFAGVPSLSFSSVRSYNPQHLEIARRAARQLECAFVTRDSGDEGALEELVGRAASRSAE